MDSKNLLDIYLSPAIRRRIEADFYAKINAQAKFEQASQDPAFLDEVAISVALYSDHGVVHVRDVAGQILHVLSTVNGVLIPGRDPNRLAFMKGYGVIIAYLHDIGMTDLSQFGRTMHPEFATQTVFEPTFDELVQTIWDENWGNVAWRLTNLAGQGALPQAPQLVLRELLAMSNCHSKSKVPVHLLNQPAQLRPLMQRTVATRLERLYNQPPGTETPIPRPGQTDFNPNLSRFYQDVERESFRWLVAPGAEMEALVADVIDTLRALRCADALRQRGTVLKSSGSYEIFVDQRTANAIFALRQGDSKLYLLELNDPTGAGEANIASSEIDPDGNLRISFHRGAFASPATTQRAATFAAQVVEDIQADVIDSFTRPGTADYTNLKTSRDIEILLEGVEDNLDFASQVLKQLSHLNPQAAAQARVVPSLQNVSEAGRTRYLRAEALEWTTETLQEILDKIASSGHKTGQIDPVEAFQDVRLTRVRTGEVLVEAEEPAGFVYVPLGPGLKIIPLGGYRSFSVQAWMPLGNTGVIRGAPRNASVVAEQDVMLLMIPKEAYLKRWHHTYTLAELRQRLERDEVRAQAEEKSGLRTVDKLVILSGLAPFAQIPAQLLSQLAAITRETKLQADITIFNQGEEGDKLYIIVDGQVRIHQGTRTLNYLGPSEIFGELAALGGQQRAASATTITETRLLHVDHATLAELLADRVDVTQGLIQVLSQHIQTSVHGRQKNS